MCVNKVFDLEKVEEKGSGGSRGKHLDVPGGGIFLSLVLVFYFALCLCKIRFWTAFSFLQNK